MFCSPGKPLVDQRPRSALRSRSRSPCKPPANPAGEMRSPPLPPPPHLLAVGQGKSGGDARGWRGSGCPQAGLPPLQPSDPSLARARPRPSPRPTPHALQGGGSAAPGLVPGRCSSAPSPDRAPCACVEAEPGALCLAAAFPFWAERGETLRLRTSSPLSQAAPLAGSPPACPIRSGIPEAHSAQRRCVRARGSRSATYCSHYKSNHSRTKRFELVANTPRARS